MASFSQQILAFNDKFEAAVRITGREAVQETVNIAQQTRGQGGRMRVLTGFLRASIQAALGVVPTGPVDNDGDRKHPLGSQVAGEPVGAVLLRWDPAGGVPIVIGWTAAYARHREAQDRFLQGAIELWPQSVRKGVAKAKAHVR